MRAFVVPFGFFHDPKTGNQVAVTFLQQVDHLLPQYAGKLKAIGGEVEMGELPVQTVLRESEEECPGWLKAARYPATSKGFFGKKATSNGLVPIHADDHVVIYATYVDVGPMSWAMYRNNTLESCPVSMTLEQIMETNYVNWVFPQMKSAIVEFINSIRV